nr:hypothetical protein [Tanacetum cinerariifolium]
LVFVDLDISTQADEAQSSRVPVPLPEDPYETFREAYLVGTDTKSELIKGQEEDEEVEDSSDSDSESKDAKDEGPTVKDEDPAAGDEGLTAGDEALTAISEPFGLGYGELRRQEIALAEGQMPSVFEIHPEDGIAYIDVPTYPPPAPPVQTPPSPEWTSATPVTAETKGFFTKLGAQVEMHGGFIRDHTVRLWELSPDLFERYDRDVGSYLLASRVVVRDVGDERSCYYFGAGEEP